MANQIGTYHLAANPQLYEPQRANTFSFVVTDIDDLVQLGSKSGAIFANAQEILSVACSGAPVPHFSQDIVRVRRGNNEIKFAGTVTFEAGTLKLRDYIGANVKEILMAWRTLSYDIETGNVGALARSPYKKDCYLIEYAPDFEVVRRWVLHGCWISNISEGDYDADNGDKKDITATIQYDWANIDTSERE